MIQKTEAIVLKTLRFRSSSLIVTFYTKDFGKIKGVVKGVYREGERRSAEFEPCTHLEIVFYEKKRSDLHLISESFMMESHLEDRESLESIAYASYFCELVDELTEVYDPHPFIFELLKVGFRYLSVIPPSRMATLFEMKLLREMGWVPYLEGCSHCDLKPLEKGYFSIRQGALLCDRCQDTEKTSTFVEAQVLDVLRTFNNEDLEFCLKHHYSPQIEEKLRALLSRFLRFRLAKPLKTGKFMNAIKPVLSS